MAGNCTNATPLKGSPSEVVTAIGHTATPATAVAVVSDATGAQVIATGVWAASAGIQTNNVPSSTRRGNSLRIITKVH